MLIALRKRRAERGGEGRGGKGSENRDMQGSVGLRGRRTGDRGDVTCPGRWIIPVREKQCVFKDM